MGADDWIHLGLIAGYGAVIWLLWRTPVLFPFKLITIYIHEMGHAIAGWASGATVHGISVNANEGGVTRLTGGKMWMILPAGYLGSAFFGSALVLLGTRQFTSYIAAGLLIACLVLSLRWVENVLTVALTVGFIAGIGLLWYFQNGRFLPYLINFIGTMSALYAIYDVYDDTIRRHVPQSDAALLAERTSIPAVAWGVIWCIFSVGMLVGALYLGIRLRMSA
ncbi:MAG: M50 family peptidase [Deltaproteobacteria bacterium]|nr:MAG: M50 family peptidase [Deltaproteobacteria bacterium]